MQLPLKIMEIESILSWIPKLNLEHNGHAVQKHIYTSCVWWSSGKWSWKDKYVCFDSYNKLWYSMVIYPIALPDVLITQIPLLMTSKLHPVLAAGKRSPTGTMTGGLFYQSLHLHQGIVNMWTDLHIDALQISIKGISKRWRRLLEHDSIWIYCGLVNLFWQEQACIQPKTHLDRLGEVIGCLLIHSANTMGYSNWFGPVQVKA